MFYVPDSVPRIQFFDAQSDASVQFLQRNFSKFSVKRYQRNPFVLSLEGDCVGILGVRDLVKGLHLCPYLKDLRLYGNYLGNDGVKILAMALPKCLQLEKLDLDSNYISALGIESLALSVSKCYKLTEISLFGNLIGVEGGRVLVKMLLRNPRITELYFKADQVVDSDRKKIEMLLQKNRTEKNFGFLKIVASAKSSTVQLLPHDIWAHVLTYFGSSEALINEALFKIMNQGSIIRENLNKRAK